MRQGVRRLRSLFRFAKRTRTVEEFERMFRLFREVLDGNNRALEIITEMGEVLGGEYLFDAQYVKRARERLRASVSRSLDAFDELTGGRHGRLREVASSIDGMMGRVLDEAIPAGGELVLFPEEITPDRAGAVGGKGASLALLRNAARLEVPDGFVVTTWGFDAFVRHNGIDRRIVALQRRPADPASAPAELRRLVRAGEIPPDLGREIERAIEKLRARCGDGRTVSVRSSAESEDGEHSFAGQFETVLNVPLRRDAVEEAYRQVVASLFSPKAVAYQERLGYAPGAGNRMAVACMAMVDAAVSGVLYTSNPVGARDTMVISAAWGLGPPVVDGRTDADHLVVRKDGTGTVIEERVGEKSVMAVPRASGGTEEIETPEAERRRRCLDAARIARLIDAGLIVERHFRSPQDVEWAFDASGKLFVLQARPLRMQEPAAAGRAPSAEIAARRIAFKRRGIVVQEGAVSGKVHVARNAREIDSAPRGSVLVARHDSPDVVRVMPLVSAIVTDTGAATSHMASLSREFRVPTIVNTGDATRALAEGQEVTVLAARDGAAVYPGVVAQALAPAPDRPGRMEDLREFRRRRYVLRLVAPLNLVDPLRDDFTPEACRTVHDVLRFVHEKSVASLIEGAGLGAGSRGAVRLHLSVPAGIAVIDIGGGLASPVGERSAVPEQITSVPFKALVAGMTHPGVWRSEAVPLTPTDFISGMLHAPDVLSGFARPGETNVAVISRDYANLNLKFGYHYTIVDAYCSSTARNNLVNFRFAGGATDITKRSRRLRFIATVLEEHGFKITTKGDLLVGRLDNVQQDDMVAILDQVGRLIAYTRQLDAVLHDRFEVERLARRFLGGTYEGE